MDTANFINVDIQVYYSFLKHNIFSTKAIESFGVVWIIEETRLENWQRVSSTSLSKTLLLSLHAMQMVREEVAEVSYCYYSQDSRMKFPCIEAAKFNDRDQTFWDVLPAAPRGRFRTLRRAKGYESQCALLVGSQYPQDWDELYCSCFEIM